MGAAPSTAVTAVNPRADDAEAKGSNEDGELWVSLRAKTTCKRTRTTKKKKLDFKPTAGGMRLGKTAGDCDMVLDDSYLSPEHATITVDDASNVVLNPVGRTYWLIGQSNSPGGPQPLGMEQVVKMGACSLQITEMCTTAAPLPAATEQLRRFSSSSESGICYICFDDTSTDSNPIVPSPCTCAKLVHRRCLSRWIATKGSRCCSICKSKLPINFTVEPPFLVLQVVRHMRGLTWSGEREYIISFNQRPGNAVTVGSGSECDLHLPDPSLSRTHAKLQFQDGQFYVQDLGSSAGTFLKLLGPQALPLDAVSEFKMGRTTVTVKVKRKKSLLPWKSKKR